MWSRAVAGEPKSDLLAVRTDEKGRPAGAPIVLHRTSGTVLALLVTQSAVTVEEPTIWVGWMTYVAGDASASRIVAALRITAALDKVSRPVTVHHGRAPGYMDGDINPDLLVGSGSPSGGLTLSYALDGVDLSHGKRHVDHVAPEGIVRALGIIGPAGGDGGDGGLLDIGSGVLAWSMAYKGGPNWVNKFFPYVPGTPASKLKLIECSHLPLLRYFNGREVITHCPTDSFSEEEPCFLKTKELPGWVGPFCARVLVQRLDGTVLTPVRKGSAPEPVPLTADREICVGGSWRRELAWQGGSVRLEQDVPGAPPPRQPCTAGTRRPYKESD